MDERRLGRLLGWVLLVGATLGVWVGIYALWLGALLAHGCCQGGR